MAGLFFCLASAEGCRAFALLCCNVATHKRLQRVLHRKCNYTANTAKQHTGLYRGFFWDLSHSTATNTRPAQAAIIPPVPRWSAHTRPDALHRYQIQPPCRTLCSSAQAPYYNKVYKWAPLPPVMDPCQTVQHTADHASTAGSAPTVCGSLASAAPGAPGAWHHPPGGAVQQQGRGGRRGTIGGSRRISFRAFAR